MYWYYIYIVELHVDSLSYAMEQSCAIDNEKLPDFVKQCYYLIWKQSLVKVEVLLSISSR